MPGVDRALRRRAARDRQLGVRERLEVGDVLAEDRRGAHGVEDLAVAGHDVLGLLDERREAAQRREVRVARAALGDPRDLDRREVVAADERPRARRSRPPSRRPVWPSAGCSSSSSSPIAQWPGTGSACTWPSDSGAGRRRYHSSSKARSSRAAAPGSAARRAALVSATPSAACPPNASRPSRWSQSACVASRPVNGKPACSSTAGRISSSSGRTGESMTKPSSPLRTIVHVVCQTRLVATSTSRCRPTTRMRAVAARCRAA